MDPAKLPSAIRSSHNDILHDARPQPSSVMIAAAAHAQRWAVKMSRRLSDLPRGHSWPARSAAQQPGAWRLLDGSQTDQLL